MTGLGAELFFQGRFFFKNHIPLGRPFCSPAGLLGEPPGLGVMYFPSLLREKDALPLSWHCHLHLPVCPSPSPRRSLKVRCLPMYTLFEFASSLRRLPVSINRSQERSKARAGEFREEELRMAGPTTV